MSKRAEEAALKALPNYPPETYVDEEEYIEVESERNIQRAFFRKGYEQAIKDVIALVDSNFLPAFAGKIIRLIEQEYE